MSCRAEYEIEYSLSYMSLWHESSLELIATSHRHRLPDTQFQWPKSKEKRRKSHTKRATRKEKPVESLRNVSPPPPSPLPFALYCNQSGPHIWFIFLPSGPWRHITFLCLCCRSEKPTLIRATFLTPLPRRPLPDWPFHRRKFKMFTYLTNIHYHATYSLCCCCCRCCRCRCCCCCCASIFVIYSWWYCRKSSRPHRSPSRLARIPPCAFFPFQFRASRTAHPLPCHRLPLFAESAFNPWLLLNSEASSATGQPVQVHQTTPSMCVPCPALPSPAAAVCPLCVALAMTLSKRCPLTHSARITAYVATWATLDERPRWVASSGALGATAWGNRTLF